VGVKAFCNIVFDYARLKTAAATTDGSKKKAF